MLKVKIRLALCYILSIILYGVESWTLTETLLKKLDTLKMWFYRRVLWVSWMDQVRHESVLHRMRKNTKITTTKVGHVLRDSEKYNFRNAQAEEEYFGQVNLREPYHKTSTDQ